jgi:thiaminase
MIKTNFSVNSEEKNRILNLHESATKNQYLVLEDEMSSDDIADRDRGEVFANKADKNSKYREWIAKNGSEELKKLVSVINYALKNSSNPKDKDLRLLGKYLRKNPQIEKQIEEYAKQNPLNSSPNQ